MGSLLRTVVFATVLSAQTTNTPSEPVRTVVARLELERYKTHIKGLSQFGDRTQGTQGNAMQSIGWRSSCAASGTPTSRGIGSYRPAVHLKTFTPQSLERPSRERCTSFQRTWTVAAAVRPPTTTRLAAPVVLELARVLAMSDVRTKPPR